MVNSVDLKNIIALENNGIHFEGDILYFDKSDKGLLEGKAYLVSIGGKQAVLTAVVQDNKTVLPIENNQQYEVIGRLTQVIFNR